MNFRKMKSEEVYQLMEQSFDPCEFRTYQKAKELLKDSRYQVYVMKEKETLQAFLAEWKFDEINFVEHLAVNPSIRGKGLGSKVMKNYLEEMDQPVILEVEDKQSLLAKKRIEFYKKLGFGLSDITYVQPSLQEVKDEVELRLMHYPSDISKRELIEFKQELFEKVYA